MPDRLARHRALTAVCVLGAALEAVVLPLVGLRAATGLSPQLTAVPPLGVFHDLRWLFVYHDSWPTFAAGALALVVVRSLLTTVLVRLAWPADAPRPGPRAAFLSSLGYTVVAGLLLSPMVTLLFGTAVLPFSWPFLAAVPAALLIALLIHNYGLTPGGWRALPTWRSLGWLLASFLVLSAASTVITNVPVGVAVLPAALAGLFNAWAWHGLATNLAGRRLLRWRVPVTPLAAAAFIGLAVLGAKLGFLANAAPQNVGRLHAANVSTGRAVLVVAGFGSACCYKAGLVSAGAPTLSAEQFSYRGLSADGQPLPHGAAATNRSLPDLAAEMARQVDLMHRSNGGPVSIVAESEGSLVTLAYLARYPAAPVGSVVLLSPIVDPGQVSYPAAGRPGWGLAAGYELRGMVDLIGGISPFAFRADSPLLRSVVTDAASLRLVATCRPGLHTLVVLPLADAVTLPAVARADQRVSVVVVPAFHGGLLGNPAVRAQVRDYLTGRTPPLTPGWGVTTQVLNGAAAAWRVPPLVTRAPAVGCPARVAG